MACTGMNPRQWRRLEMLRQERDPTQASIPTPVMAIQGVGEDGAADLPGAAIARMRVSAPAARVGLGMTGSPGFISAPIGATEGP